MLRRPRPYLRHQGILDHHVAVVSAPKAYTYQGYGLTFSVPFPCPGMTAVEPGSSIDIAVTEGAVARHLAAPLATDTLCDAAPGRFLCRGGPAGPRFLVEGGSRVVFERDPKTDDAMLGVRFTNVVLPALLRQRGLLVLHANAAVTSAGVVMVVGGDSGAGKSTTLGALLEYGCSMLSDDVTALGLGCEGTIEVLPGLAQLHLSEDAAKGLGVDITDLALQPWRRMKAAVPTDRRMARIPAPLGALHILSVGTGDGVEMTTLYGAAKFHALWECLYGPLFTEEHSAVFPLLCAVGDLIAVQRIIRPARRWSVGEVVGAILAHPRSTGLGSGHRRSAGA